MAIKKKSNQTKSLKSMKQNFLFFYIPCPDQKTAEKISLILLQEKVAACTNVITGMKSYYWWKSKIESSEEVLLIVKTTSMQKIKLSELIKNNHPYEVPCIAELKLDSLNQEYQDWLIKSLESS